MSRDKPYNRRCFLPHPSLRFNILLFRSLDPALAQHIPELGNDVTFATRDRQGGEDFEVIFYKFVPVLILTAKSSLDHSNHASLEASGRLQ